MEYILQENTIPIFPINLATFQFFVIICEMY